MGEEENSPKWIGWMEAWWMSFSFRLSICHSWFPGEYGWIRWPCINVIFHRRTATFVEPCHIQTKNLMVIFRGWRSPAINYICWLRGNPERLSYANLQSLEGGQLTTDFLWQAHSDGLIFPCPFVQASLWRCNLETTDWIGVPRAWVPNPPNGDGCTPVAFWGLGFGKVKAASTSLRWGTRSANSQWLARRFPFLNPNNSYS